MPLLADGSSRRDARPTVTIDRSGPDKWRFVCPNGHTDWAHTNNHIWCPACRRQAEQGFDIDPEHWEILDKKTGETIPWSAVHIKE